MQTTVPNHEPIGGTALLRATADRYESDATSTPGPADIRRAMRNCLLPHTDLGTLEIDDIVRTTWDLFANQWAREEWPQYTTVHGWAEELRLVATHLDQLTGGAR